MDASMAAREARGRLSCYLIYRRLIEEGGERAADELTLRAEMFAIRRSVMALPDSREKILLYNRYIRGETMEKCAELLGISRRSVFRLSRRAIAMYAARAEEERGVRVLT